MRDSEREFRRRLLQTFIEEAREHVDAIADGLGMLQTSPAAPSSVVETIFREAHSLKGAARSVGTRAIEQLCQVLEGVFDAAKRGSITLEDAAQFTILQTAIDTIGDMVRDLAGGQAELPTPDRHLIDNLVAIAGDGHTQTPAAGATPTAGRPAAVTASPPAGKAHVEPAGRHRQSGPDTIRVPLTRLDAVWRQGEDLLAVKLAAAQRAGKMRQLGAGLIEWKRTRAKLQPDLRRVQGWLERNPTANPGGSFASAMRRLLEFMESDREFNHSLALNVETLARAAANDEYALGTVMDNLLGDLEQVLMVPCGYAMDGFPRMVRELAAAQRKEVGLELDGMGLEMDRRILDEIRPALVHLLRNAVDHGIEAPEARTAAGKSAQGTIRIGVTALDGRRVELTVDDDGAGLDSDRLRTAAVAAGIVSSTEAASLHEHELHNFVFDSGLSTSPTVTEISGRGLGMAIVAEKVERLGGTLSLESRPDTGTRFRMVLPMSLSKFSGMLVRLGESLFVIPLTSVERGLRIRGDAVRTIENRETVTVGERILPLLPLAELLQLPDTGAHAANGVYLSMVVISAAGQRFACRVDEIIATREVLVKNLGPQLERVRNIAGATTLGSGQVVPILNPGDLVKTAALTLGKPVVPDSAPVSAMAPTRVLVVEDSVTSRTLLKSILATAGYEVGTAVDGIDALEKLRAGAFDLVVSDVEMPRMNGFDLTIKIRAERLLSNLPVVIVTSLDSPAERERGLDAGADAYLVKSDFVQSDLLDVVRRLSGQTG